MTSRRPFRLGLKTRSTDSEYAKVGKSSNGSRSTYVHPLAGQQDNFRVPSSAREMEAEAGPSRSRESLVDPFEPLVKESDIDTLSATNGWFRSLAADEESIYSSHSRAENYAGPLSAKLQEVFLEQQQQKQQQDESSTDDISVIRQPNQQLTSSLTPGKGQAELIQINQERKGASITSPAREGGILSRLKRISKKEKSRAARDQVSALDLERVSNFQADDKELPSLPSLPSSTSAKVLDVDVLHSLRDAALERTPKVERPRRDRIQSIQPSLVDNESILGRQSMSGSQADFDEDDLRDRLLLSGSKLSSVLQSESGHIGFTEEDEEDTQAPVFDLGPDLIPLDRSNLFSNGHSIDSQPATPSEFGYSFESSSFDIEPSTPAETTFHEADGSEYMDAASRQPSSYTSLHDQFTNTRTIDEQDEETITPRAVPDDARTNYFPVEPLVTPQLPTAPSSASIDTAHTPTKAIPIKKFTWYQSANLGPQERHYFLRQVLSRELAWELERLFLVSNSSSLFQPSPKTLLPRNDLGYFKKEAKGLTPDLPLTRFLFTHILSTCPLFGPSQPIEGAAAVRARKEGAKKFLEEAVLPYLRFQHETNLSHGVDIDGERPNEISDSPSTTGALMGSIFNSLVKLVAAVVPDGKSQSLPWSSIPTPSIAAYFRYRVAPSKLRQGGMEVNIVGSRLSSSSKDCELLLSVRRFGFPAHFVVRSESDFYEYALGLAEELGRRGRVRAVPPPSSREVSSSPDEEDASAVDRSSNGSPAKKTRQIDQLYGKNNRSSSSLQSLAQAKPIGRESNDDLSRLKGRNSSSASIGSNSSPRLSNGVVQQNGQSATPPTKAAVPEKSRFFYRSKTDGNTDVDASRTSLASTAILPGRYSPPITRDDEARRKQLRAWLRDTLSIRGAGHAKETKAFLESGSFSEKEIKAASKKDVQRRADIDAKLIREREVNANNASDEIIELQREMKALWKNCIEGDGLLKALEAIKTHNTFSSLPLPYQRVISWTNLQVAQFIHHIFITSEEARGNFDRATELLQCIPWKALSAALREPTGLMVQMFKSCLSNDYIVKKILALQLEDVPVKKVELEIASLRKRLGSTIMRKLEGYVISPEWQKRVIRKASKRNHIPLVAAIVRGDDKPLLAAEGIKRIMTATRLYQEFNKTNPTYEEKKAKIRVNVEVRLITDMQRGLKLLSLRRNGLKTREAMANQLEKPTEAFLEPLFSLLKRLHRSRILTRGGNNDGRDVIVDLQEFLYKLFDVLAGLKMRIQDPWRSLSTLTLFLDDAIPSWYKLLHQFATGSDSNFLLDITQWLQNICSLLSTRKKGDGEIGKGKGSSVVKLEEELAPFWQPPKGGLNQADQSSILELIEAAKVKKSRLMESACRWAAGDIDADYSIQLLGEGGKTRMTPFHLHQEYAGPSTFLSKQDGLDIYLTGLRSALSQFM